MLCVRDVMHTDFCRVEKGESIAEVARTLLFHNAECALVVDGEELLGMVTERDPARDCHRARSSESSAPDGGRGEREGQPSGLL